MSNKKYEWVTYPENKPDGFKEYPIRYGGNLDNGDKTFMQELFENGWTLIEWLKEVQPSLTINGIKAIAMAAFNYGYLTKMDDAAFEKWFSEFVEKDFPVQPSLKEDDWISVASGILPEEDENVLMCYEGSTVVVRNYSEGKFWNVQGNKPWKYLANTDKYYWQSLPKNKIN